MAEFIYTMKNVRRAIGDKVILDNVTMAFYPGAKIGVVGPNGAGKSSLLKIMAGIDQPNNGEAFLDPGATVGILLQEPPLNEEKTVRENVEEGLGDIFEAFFGGGGGARQPRSRVQPGNDALLRTSITLAEAFTGVKQDVTVDTAVLCDKCHGSGSKSGAKPVTCDVCQGHGAVQEMQQSFLGNVMTTRECHKCHGFGEVITDPCAQCAGDGRVRATRDLKVKIPAGIANGMRIRMAGQGEVGHGGGPAGDLYVEVQTAPHKIFVRDGNDLHLRLNVPMYDAALGTSIDVENLAGDTTTIEIPAGTQPGDEVRLEGEGMPRLRAEGHGDMIAHIQVVVPTHLSGEERRSLEQLRDARGDATGVHHDDERDEGFFSRMRDRFRR